MRDPTEHLRDMLEATERIECQTTGGREVFEREELVQVWVVRIPYHSKTSIVGRGVEALPVSETPPEGAHSAPAQTVPPTTPPTVPPPK